MASYKQLIIIMAVVEEGSFTAAAKKLFMTQPAISWQVKALEDDLGLQLIGRKEKGIVLTEAGELFYEYSRRILNQFDLLFNEMQQFKGLEKGTLRIGASTIPGEYLLPLYIGEFKLSHPTVSISMEIAGTGKIFDRLLEDSIHLGVVGAQIENSHLTYLPFLEDELVLIAGPKHVLGAKEHVSLGDVMKSKFIMREHSSGTRMVLEKSLHKAGVKKQDIQVELELGSTRAIITAVGSGLGLSWVSQVAAKEQIERGTVQKLEVLDFLVKRKFYIAYNMTRNLSPLAEAFRDFLIKVKKNRL
ncbi:MAG: selenium metabolism-associated LysR family transcriptional regulator [Clostridia bacterium]